MIETSLTVPKTEVVSAPVVAGTFPYQARDIDGWVVKKHDGSVVRYTMAAPGYGRYTGTVGGTLVPARVGQPWTQSDYYSGSLGIYCKHDPLPGDGKEMFAIDGPAGPLKIWVADAAGCRAGYLKFDMVIDGGSVITGYRPPLVVDGNDAELVGMLRGYQYKPLTSPKIIHMDWADRAAPPVHPEFWGALAKVVKGNIMTNCQGGHGRSGSAAVLLMMNLTDYTPFEAIVHLRAMHCPRAIESKVQHEYLSWAGELLGRKTDAHLAENIKDYRETFLKFTHECAKPFQARLIAAGKVKDVVDRD